MCIAWNPMGKANADWSSGNIETVCSICECDAHLTKDCPTIPAFKGVLHEQANALNSYKKPFSNQLGDTYKPNRPNHPSSQLQLEKWTNRKQ